MVWLLISSLIRKWPTIVELRYAKQSREHQPELRIKYLQHALPAWWWETLRKSTFSRASDYATKPIKSSLLTDDILVISSVASSITSSVVSLINLIGNDRWLNWLVMSLIRTGRLLLLESAMPKNTWKMEPERRIKNIFNTSYQLGDGKRCAKFCLLVRKHMQKMMNSYLVVINDLPAVASSLALSIVSSVVSTGSFNR